MLEERVAQLEEQLEEQLLGGEGDGQQQQEQLRLQAEDHLLERSKLRSTRKHLSVCVHRSLSSGYCLVFSQSMQIKMLL